jgi:HEXXH motif-containing protein
MPFEVVRYDVDPLVAEIAPPTYVFPAPKRAQELEAKTAYSLELFQSVAGAALLRIGRTWPEVRALFPCFVRAIVHLPDAEFRSASASRYAGLIFLTADDRTILEVEESLIHEWAHQVLYSVMELDPIVVAGEQGSLTLPWSGARRDFYGYFHALFVYTLLLRYLERIDDRGSEEMGRVRERFDQILRGAVAALPDFNDDARFTQRGRKLRGILREAVETRARRHDTLVGDGGYRG